MKLTTLLNSKPTEQEMVSAGFRNNEQPIELLDTEPPKNSEFNINQNTRLGFHIINEDRAKTMNDKAIELGVIQEPKPMPYIKKQRPEAAKWKPIRQNFISPFMRHINGLFVLEMIDGIVFAHPTDNKEAVDLTNYLTIKDTEELHDHLTSGHLAYMSVSGMSPAWITVPEYNALVQYRVFDHEFIAAVDSWRDLKADIKRAEIDLRTTKQHADLENLPFEWYTDIKQVLSGLSEHSNGSGMKRNSVEHIMLNEDFKKGRFSRKKHDYLCSPKKVSNWGIRDRYEKLEVTCKACLSRAETLIKNS